MTKWIGGALTLVVVGAVVGGIALFMHSHDLMNRVAVCEAITGPDVQRIFESPALRCSDPGIGSVQYSNRAEPETIVIEAGMQTAKTIGEAGATYEASRAAAEKAASRGEGSSDAAEHYEVVKLGDEAFWAYTQAGPKLVRGRIEWRHDKTNGAVSFAFKAPTDGDAGAYKAHCLEVATKLIKLDEQASQALQQR